MISAKEQLPHGSWERWVKEQVGVSTTTAKYLVALARNPALTNRQHADDLPSDYTTLYELSRLDPPQLEEAITEGKVTPEMPRKAAIPNRSPGNDLPPNWTIAYELSNANHGSHLPPEMPGKAAENRACSGFASRLHHALRQG